MPSQVYIRRQLESTKTSRRIYPRPGAQREGAARRPRLRYARRARRRSRRQSRLHICGESLGSSNCRTSFPNSLRAGPRRHHRCRCPYRPDLSRPPSGSTCSQRSTSAPGEGASATEPLACLASPTATDPMILRSTAESTTSTRTDRQLQRRSDIGRWRQQGWSQHPARGTAARDRCGPRRVKRRGRITRIEFAHCPIFQTHRPARSIASTARLGSRAGDCRRAISIAQTYAATASIIVRSIPCRSGDLRRR